MKQQTKKQRYAVSTMLVSVVVMSLVSLVELVSEVSTKNSALVAPPRVSSGYGNQLLHIYLSFLCFYDVLGGGDLLTYSISLVSRSS